MKWGEAEKYITKQLETCYDESEAVNIAAILIENITSFSRSKILLKKDEVLSASQLNGLNQYIQRLLQYEPVQYVLNEAHFYGMKLYVDKDVLIPRPETEELVEWIINDVRASGKNVFQKKATDADVTTQLKLLDVGTGSGCIALALKKKMPRAEVWGCDISDRALNVARRNGSELDIRVDFQSVDYLDPAQQKHLPTVDIVVSNPPYVPSKNKNEMQPNVLQYEPHTALFVDDNDALVFYKALLHFGKHRLYTNGIIYMEIDENSASDIKALFENDGYVVEVRKDMQGKERMVRAHPHPPEGRT